MNEKPVFLIICLVAIAACTQTVPSEMPTTPENPTQPLDTNACTPQERAAQVCAEIYAPVCGELRNGTNRTFSNRCFACADKEMIALADGECSGAPVEQKPEPEKPPVADETGFIACSEESRNAVCTLDYSPVCAEVDNGIRCITTPCDSSDKKTYSNPCMACANEKTYGYRIGACPQEETPRSGTVAQKSAICNTATDEENAERTGFNCVDYCPDKYDSYMTQIGIEVCIPHADKTTFLTWDRCERATDCGNEQRCVYALYSTNSQRIEWPRTKDENRQPEEALRCVPDAYADFLLHTSGQSGVDENGEFYTVIA